MGRHNKPVWPVQKEATGPRKRGEMESPTSVECGSALACRQVLGWKGRPSPTPPLVSFLPEALGPLAGQHLVGIHWRSWPWMSPFVCCSGVSVQPGLIERLFGFIPGSGEAPLCQRCVPSREAGPGCQADAHLCTSGRGPHEVWGRQAEQRDTCRPSVLVPPPPHTQGRPGWLSHPSRSPWCSHGKTAIWPRRISRTLLS